MTGRHRRPREDRDSYRKRGGYISTGSPITELPVVPDGPAPGARPVPPYDPDWTIVAWVRRP